MLLRCAHRGAWPSAFHAAGDGSFVFYAVGLNALPHRGNTAIDLAFLPLKIAMVLTLILKSKKC